MNEFFKKPVVKILMLKGEKGDKGNTGEGFPRGGQTGQYLQKKSNADYDFAWSPITTVSWDKVSGKTYATESTAGLMSAEDKTALDGIANGTSRQYINNSIHFDDLNSIIAINGSNAVIGWSKIGASNLPHGLNGNACLVIQGGSENYMVQMAIGFGARKIAIRNKFSSSVWSDWEYIEPRNSTTKSFTLSAASWNNYEGDYWWCDVQDSLITETSNQEIIPDNTITADQLKALQKANLVCNSQAEGHLYLRVFGTKPTIDIPIRIIFRGTI